MFTHIYVFTPIIRIVSGRMIICYAKIAAATTVIFVKKRLYYYIISLTAP